MKLCVELLSLSGSIYSNLTVLLSLPTKRELLADMKRLLRQTTISPEPVLYNNSAARSFSTPAIRLFSFPDFQFILFEPTETRY